MIENFNIDVAIILIFLAVNLIAGLYSGRGVKTVVQYALGDRDFNTPAIAATIIATWISGSFFTVSISQTYREGVWFIPAAMADVISLLIISYIFAPRVKEFFGHLSVAESMGKLYGGNIRLVTAICSLAQSIAMIALQIKVFATIFEHFLYFSFVHATLLSSGVVIAYSAIGGIKSVTFTDIIQYLTFGIFIPMFALFVWQVFGNSENIVQEFSTNPLLDYTQILNYENPRFWPNFVMFLWFMIPSLSSPTFQRMLMAKNTAQVHSAFGLAAIGYTVIMVFICVIGLLVLAVDSTLDPNSIVVYMVDNYSFPGLRGITVIGLMAMVMSTADSWINTGAVIFAHDLCKPMGVKFKNELIIARIFSVVVGGCAVLLVLNASSLFKLFSLQANFYMPIITVPLTLAILGFRTTAIPIWIGMISGGLSVVGWKMFMADTGVDSVIPAMASNFITLMLSHYFFRQKGGWIGVDDPSDLQQIRLQRQRHFAHLVNFFKRKHSFSLIEYCNSRKPKSPTTYSYFASSSLLLILVIFSLDKGTYLEHSYTINCVGVFTAFIGTLFACYRILPEWFRNKYLGIIWHLAVFINLALISSFLVLISNFSQISLIVFILSLSVIGLLLNWQAALLEMGIGVASAFWIYEAVIGKFDATTIHDPMWHIVYYSLITGAFVIAFLKPKQEYQELSEEKIDYLTSRISDYREELYMATELKYEFLRNLQHEARTPITGITSLAQAVDEIYDKLPEEKRRQAIHDIAMNAERLESYVNNLIDLSKLSSMKYDLELVLVNLSELVHEKLDECKKFYITELQKEDREFILDIEADVIADCDKYYIGRTLENIIINAIQYCKRGKIEVRLTKTAGGIEFSVKDEGMGIPQKDLRDIFGAFTVSSKTRTPAGGRGVGLALAKKVIELHKGSIIAESDGESWTMVSFNLTT